MKPQPHKPPIRRVTDADLPLCPCGNRILLLDVRQRPDECSVCLTRRLQAAEVMSPTVQLFKE